MIDNRLKRCIIYMKMDISNNLNFGGIDNEL